MATPIKAIAVFDTKRIKGTVLFTAQMDGSVVVDVNISGLKKNGKHGFHVHTYGDMSDKCESMCAHFNPYGTHHGGPSSKHRHVGDLGNLIANNQGIAQYRFVDHFIRLNGTKSNIIGRGLIIHEDEDDLGMGGNEASLITGNAGKRIACAVIGHARPDAKC
jgi:Cu-Zn family superoxide dismutase